MRKVFVSSTSEDLEAYRQAAQAVVLDIGWHPVMMEHFGTDGSAGIVEACKKRVADSDLVLAILGWRRGWVPGPEVGGDGRSITQIEIDTAKALGKPIATLLARDDWPGKLWESDPGARRKVETLRGIDRLAVFFGWEPVEVGALETLPQFRAKVRQELLRHLQTSPVQSEAQPVPQYPNDEVRAKPSPTARPPRAKSSVPKSTDALIPYLEREVANLSKANRAGAVLSGIERTLPFDGEDLKTLGVVAWALDYFPGRSAKTADRQAAQSLRERVFAPLRERRPPQPQPWAAIPGGSFQMGSPAGEGDSDERPAHQVAVSTFRLGIYAVTAADYPLFAGQGGSQVAHLAAMGMDWYSAYAYAVWLGGRLPTEAEWEYAARGGTEHEYADRFGKDTTLDRVGWHSGNARQEPKPVGQLEPNPWGLYDMIGNVWEWVADWYAPYSSESQADPWGPASGKGRVVRGGSAMLSANFARATVRGRGSPDLYDVGVGFRVALPASQNASTIDLRAQSLSA